MKKTRFLLLFLLLSTSVFSQLKGDYVWPLGYGTYDGKGDGESGMLLDFNQASPSITQVTLLPEPLAFIGDSAGSLVAYTNGCRINNGNNTVIENGDSLNAGTWFGNFCGNSSYRTEQGCLFLQKPGNPDLHYLFHIRYEDFTGWPHDLLYTLTDMTSNAGLGKVVEKNQLIEHVRYAPYITAVRHGNGRDWWIVVPRLFTNGYSKLLLTPDGIQGPFVQEIGDSMTLGACCGQTAFSADGNKYFKFLPRAGLQILNFDRCNGEFSNPLFIKYGSDTVGLGGVVGSPNSRFLYLSTGNNMYQYDLQSSNIPASRQTVGTYDGYVNPFPAGFYQGARGPDGKIYHVSNNGVKVLHVMHNPDELGLACNFEQHGIELPAYQSFFMPNFANYRLYDLPGSACDTLGINAPTVAVEEVKQAPGAFRVMPNPSSGLVQLVLPEGIADASLRVLDLSGRMVLEQQLHSDAPFSIDLSRNPAGLYWLILRDHASGVQSIAKVVVQYE